MKKLWKTVPPCLSDTMGFLAVTESAEGLGIIDDPSSYKPLRIGQGGDPGRGFGGRHGSGGHEHGKHERGGHEHGGRGAARTVNSEIRSSDIISGTHAKVMDAFAQASVRISPQFVLLCHAPSASMIGSDLQSDAEEIQAQSGIPAAFVNIDGGKDYLYGVSAALEAMGRLLLHPADTVPGTVNLLGCNSIDWTDDMLRSAEALLRENGFRVLSRWGMKDTAEHLRAAASAQFNLVVSAAGLRLARYMETEFGIPYAAGAPFGEAAAGKLLAALRGETPAEIPAADGPAALVVGEQLTACAVRDALLRRGCGKVRVCSFYETDKALMQPGDAKLGGEDDLKALLADEALQLVVCDPDCRPLAERPVRWVSLPNPASQCAIESIPRFDMTGSGLDVWLDAALEKGV